MADENTQNAISASLASIEANIIIAGLEAVVGIWIIYATYTNQCVIPDLPDKWHWSYAFYTVLGFLVVIVAGFVLEAAAGVMERVVTRPLFGKGRETAWQWYLSYTKQPDPENIANAQKWIWKSPQAHQEFSRRRLRILAARNTATSFVLFAVSWLLFGLSPFWILVVLLFGAAIFTWLWIDAQKAWNLTVNMTNKLGEP